MKKLAALGLASLAVLPNEALAHPGHDGGLGHVHAETIGLAIVMAIGVAFVLRMRRQRQ